jgi:ATP-dependent Clp protease ATP-binding subunit ClpA
MPFINDKLSANQEQLDRAHYAKQLARSSRFQFEPEQVMAQLRARIVGQDAVLESMADMLYHVKADFGGESRPLSVNLFLGPTGVGKTETVRILAESILGGADKLCRIDMNTLAQEHYAAALTGAPPGYVGSKEGHTLFNIEAIQGSFSQPGIVLFDEIEKASTEVIRTLLNVLDTGRLVLSAGTKEINFTNAMIFMTSNVGAKDIQLLRESHRFGWRSLFKRKSKEDAILKRALQTKFDPEFLNRIDRILSFNHLSDKWLDKILDVEITKLNDRLRRKHARLILDNSAREQFYHYYDPQYGARNLSRQLRVKLEPLLARAMIEAKDEELFEVCFCDNRFIIRAVTENIV